MRYLRKAMAGNIRCESPFHQNQPYFLCRCPHFWPLFRLWFSFLASLFGTAMRFFIFGREIFSPFFWGKNSAQQFSVTKAGLRISPVKQLCEPSDFSPIPILSVFISV